MAYTSTCRLSGATGRLACGQPVLDCGRRDISVLRRCSQADTDPAYDSTVNNHRYVIKLFPFDWTKSLHSKTFFPLRHLLYVQNRNPKLYGLAHNPILYAVANIGGKYP